MSKKTMKKHKKGLMIGTIIVTLLIIIIILCLPLKIAVPSTGCNGLKKVGAIEIREVYSYCIDKVIIIPSLNKNMTTKDLLKGTIPSGKTNINKGINYVIIDCDDNMKPKMTPLIITKEKYIDEAMRYCRR